MALDLLLDELRRPAAGEARQQRLYRLLKQAIVDGRLGAGLRLPASRRLAGDLAMARNGVLYAYQQLLAEGFLVADRGGTRVARLPAAPTLPLSLPAVGVLSQRAAALSASARGEPTLPFAPGVPDLNAFPWPLWSRLLQEAWRAVGARHLAYAEVGGEPVLRQAIASFLGARRGVVCTAEQVFILPGAQAALDACARLLADPGDLAWVEAPGYPVARNTLLAAGLTVQSVPVDGQGMAAPDALWRERPPRLLHLTPSHQYPGGSVLALERRLAFLARLVPGEHWLIEDDYDSEFNHARPLPAIQGLRPEAPVVYLGTFSKLLYPGLRIAYLVLPRWAVDSFGQALGELHRGGQAVEQRALARFLDSGRLTRHLRAMAPVYRARQQVLRAALNRHFPGASIAGGDAGLHLVLHLPGRAPDTAIVAAAAGQGVAARALSRYSSDGGDNGLVLGYGMADAAIIPELVRRLAVATARAEVA
ncbi:PLP-dependent aminotransferase family protein [Azonexus fungiphilus]|uniref:MocR-like pyridoxine biosynthesis transcription factor PdxR n=1 Tax=Azonexus fungiphilus TaxID=146940 RepID=UPI00156B0E1B|nr:PLP-dependent aminotransferase family protein [Azonexus fungiphilus]NHC05777.1 PLP-dependent aminotransferase family protein [Azonexus fungiphilus]